MYDIYIYIILIYIYILIIYYNDMTSTSASSNSSSLSPVAPMPDRWRALLFASGFSTQHSVPTQQRSMDALTHSHDCHVFSLW